MNNFSEKELLSVQDIVTKSFPKKCLDLEDRKTQVSITTIDETSKHEIRPRYQSWADDNETDQVTTLTSQLNVSKQNESQTFNKSEDLGSLKNLKADSIYYEGAILRKQQGLISSWEKRYIVLTSGKLFFFQNQKKTHLMGCVYIKHLPVSVIQNQSNFQLTCNNEGQKIIMKGINEIQTLLWVNKLNDVIEHCKGQKKVSIRKFNRAIYEQKDFILQEQFFHTAQTGDLLLVSSDNSVSYLQKFFTHSQFNHVAMIFRFKQQLKVFEANQQDGVSIYDWKQYLQIFRDHKRFAWRKLNSSKKQDFQEKLKQLAKKYIGRCYSLSTSKLLRRTSLQTEQEQNREFFCSQIVAKLYKSISLLDQEISSVRYWPITFTSRGQLNFLDGSYLSSQKNILLSKHLKL